MKPLTGREASVLALLAQGEGLSPGDKRRILATLDGHALKIAKAIVGETKHPEARVRAAAEGFRAWARDLSPSG